MTPNSDAIGLIDATIVGSEICTDAIMVIIEYIIDFQEAKEIERD